MLKLRVFTALLLMPLVLAAIFWLPGIWFVPLLAFIMLACTWEYVRLAGFSGATANAVFLTAQAGVFALLYYSGAFDPDQSALWLGGFVVVWFVLFIRLLLFRSGAVIDSQYRILSFVTAIASVTSGWFALCWLRLQDQGPWLILLLLLIVWAADTGAYFAGKKFGKRKLAPQISPGKTTAGLIGGLLLAALVAWIAAQMMPLPALGAAEVFGLSVVTVLVSVGGDLMVSMHKRISGFKDSGSILPGHGGILDRLDSLLAAAPVFALGLHLAAG